MIRTLHRVAVICLAFVAVLSESSGAESYLEITLDRAVSVALDNNRDVIKAREDAIKAGLQITEAASAAYPQINGSWETNKNLKPQVFVIEFPDSTGKITKNRLKVGTDHTMQLGANLVQPIWMGGKVGTALKAAKIYKKLSDETFKSVQHNVVTGVTTAFYSILLAQEMVDISKSSLEMSLRHLENVQALYNAGNATDYDLLRARVQAENLRPDVIDAENQVAVALLQFKENLGVDPTASLTISGELDMPDTTLVKAANADRALDFRPDLKAAAFTVNMHEKNVRLAFGDFLPNLTAGTTFAYIGNFDTWKYNAMDWTPYWFANVTLSFPIFTGFKTTSLYKQAKVELRKSKTDFRRTRDSIVIEVDQSAMNLNKAVQLIHSRGMNVTEAEKAVEIAESLYKNGRATQLEVLDAQLALEVSRTNLANALYEGKVAEINLKKALGAIDIDL